MIARLRALLDSDGGLTLPEMLVTITILSMVMSGVTAAFVSTARGVGAADVTMEDLGVARNALDRMGQLLRSASDPTGQQQGALDDYGLHVAFQTATPSEVVFWSTVGRAATQHPVRVRLVVEADGDLLEQVWLPAAGPTWPDPPRSRVIARNVADPAVFTYLTEDTTAASCLRQLSGTAVLSTDLHLIDAVGIDLRVHRTTGYDSAPADLHGFVRIAAAEWLGYSRHDQGECG